jgi:hypothetical protein
LILYLGCQAGFTAQVTSHELFCLSAPVSQKEDSMGSNVDRLLVEAPKVKHSSSGRARGWLQGNDKLLDVLSLRALPRDKGSGLGRVGSVAVLALDPISRVEHALRALHLCDPPTTLWGGTPDEHSREGGEDCSLGMEPSIPGGEPSDARFGEGSEVQGAITEMSTLHGKEADGLVGEGRGSVEGLRAETSQQMVSLSRASEPSPAETTSHAARRAGMHTSAEGEHHLAMAEADESVEASAVVLKPSPQSASGFKSREQEGESPSPPFFDIKAGAGKFAVGPIVVTHTQPDSLSFGTRLGPCSVPWEWDPGPYAEPLHEVPQGLMPVLASYVTRDRQRL